MKAYLAFTKKEFVESLRTYKFIIMLVVFLLLGVMNPLVAKFTPMLLESLGTGGLSIAMPEPTAMDSWTQFFKNVGQMGFLAMVILFAGIMASEFSRGTLINILTKGMKRYKVILSKLTMAVVVWTLSYLLCFAVTYGYTSFYWAGIEMHHAFLAFFSLWLFGLLLIALLIFGGTVFTSFIGSLLFCGAAVIAMNILNIVPKLQKYNPVSLSGIGVGILSGDVSANYLIPSVLICVFLIFTLVMASIVIFNKKQL